MAGKGPSDGSDPDRLIGRSSDTGDENVADDEDGSRGGRRLGAWLKAVAVVTLAMMIVTDSLGEGIGSWLIARFEDDQSQEDRIADILKNDPDVLEDVEARHTSLECIVESIECPLGSDPGMEAEQQSGRR